MEADEHRSDLGQWQTAQRRADRRLRAAGVGLDCQNMDKLFDAFDTTKRDGMGMRLSISRSIVERHRGRIWAEPNAGPGATFSFSIPVKPIPKSNCLTLATSD